MNVCKELMNVSEEQAGLYREVLTKKKGMERIGGGKKKGREEKEGGENSPLVKDRQGSTGT
jgi:hypothetical protein